MIATNDLIYLVTNVFYAYILCKFMRAFFGQKGKNQKAEILSFVAYYCVISVIYVGFHNSIVTLWSNLMLYFLLTFNYESSFKLRLANVIFIYALLFSSETIALLLLKLLGFGHFSEFNGMEYVTAQIFIGVIYYVLILIFSNYKLQKTVIIQYLFHIGLQLLPCLLVCYFQQLLLPHLFQSRTRSQC